MTDAATNIRAIEGTVKLLNATTRRGRNRVVRAYHNRLTPPVQESITYLHGSQVYPNKTLETFFNLIDKRPFHLPIHFAGGDDNDLLARAANDLSNMVYTRALAFKASGRHLASLNMYIREVGGSALINLNTGNVSAEMLPERAVISIVPVVDYANTLEARAAMGGILYHVARRFRGKYGKQIAVKFGYIGGQRIGEPGGSFPRIQIGHYGNLKPKMTRPGQSAKRGARRGRRGYAQVMGRQA